MRALAFLMTIALFPQFGCAGCAGFGDDPDDRTSPNSRAPWREADAGDANGQDIVTDAASGRVDEADGREGPSTDASIPPDVATNDFGTDVVESDAGEPNLCGDGTLQANETCDDGITLDCINTHDGGDGVCVPPTSCSPGYVLVGATCTANGTGLSVPCQNGSGFTVFRYHYSTNSTSAQIDVWDANCAYSFAPSSACNVYEICPGFCDPDVTSDGYPIFDTSDYMRVRFDANGLSFTRATLHVQARSYATSSSTSFRVWSPLYGETFGGPVDNDFVYDWYVVDWTGFLYPSDDPGLTAIQLYGSNGAVAVKAVELCVE